MTKLRGREYIPPGNTRCPGAVRKGRIRWALPVWAVPGHAVQGPWHRTKAPHGWWYLCPTCGMWLGRPYALHYLSGAARGNRTPHPDG